MNTLPRRRTYDGKREFVRFPDNHPFSLSQDFLYIYSRLYSFYIYLFFSHVLIFLILSLIYLSFSLCLFFLRWPYILLDFMRRRELMRNGRTELILRAGEKQKARLSSLEFYRVLAITPAKRGSSRRSFCKRLLNIQT